MPTELCQRAQSTMDASFTAGPLPATALIHMSRLWSIKTTCSTQVLDKDRHTILQQDQGATAGHIAGCSLSLESLLCKHQVLSNHTGRSTWLLTGKAQRRLQCSAGYLQCALACQTHSKQYCHQHPSAVSTGPDQNGVHVPVCQEQCPAG